ncbi:MAG: hypothetical protein E7Z80_07805 [Methanobrevibacter thaueri]|nr:hypothetical protein [Methanobrevibacter thaueri]
MGGKLSKNMGLIKKGDNMLNKKYIFLILILVNISIISSASATENIIDVMANDTGVNDAITTIDDTTGDTLAEN